ncbi:MAG: preprotein translocase subunit SecG [Candidatus Paceibacterota bacterium]|jgi:protein translocase SecG subunit
MTSILNLLPYIQLVLSALLVVAVLIQTSEAGLGSSFGSDGSSAGFRTRRGFDKVIFIATIIIAILFAAASLVSIITR